MGDFKFDIKVSYNKIDISNANVPMQQIAKKIATEAQKNIRTSTSPDGSRIQNLAKTTLDKKRRLGQPSTPLIAKGMMYRAIHVYKLAKNSFAVGVWSRGKPQRDLLALIHQEMGASPKRVVRPFMGVSDKIRTYAYDRMQRWIAERFNKATKKRYSIKLY